MDKKFEFQSPATAKKILEFISQSLPSFKLDSKEVIRNELISEEVLTKLIEHADFTKKNFISVNVKKFLGDVRIELKVPGPEFDFNSASEFSADDDNFDNEGAIRDIILRSFSDKITYRNKKNFNAVNITAARSQYSSLYKILASLILAVVTGIFLKNFVPENLAVMINNNIFTSVHKIFINGLKMCAVPIIFFSVISCFAAENIEMAQMKRVGVKLFSMFESLHVISALVGIFSVWLFGTGKGANLIATVTSGNVQNFNLSLRDTFMNIIPGNFIKPFLDGNLLQLTVLGIFIGITAKVTAVKNFIAVVNDLIKIFAKIISYMLRFIPLIVFCSIASVILTTGLQTLLSVINILLTMCAAFLILNVILSLMIFLFARLNPLTFYKKSLQVFITGFSTNSSDATMPDAMRSLEKMGVPPGVYSFAIPLGMAISKMANPMYMFISILSVSNMYNVEITAEKILSIFVPVTFVITLLPGIPGIMLTAMSSFFAAVGCPAEGIAFIMALDIIAGMIIKTQGNVFGVTVPALIIAKQENLLNVEKYNS